jgi:hypothetical protein
MEGHEEHHRYRVIVSSAPGQSRRGRPLFIRHAFQIFDLDEGDYDMLFSPNRKGAGIVMDSGRMAAALRV